MAEERESCLSRNRNLWREGTESEEKRGEKEVAKEVWGSGRGTDVSLTIQVSYVLLQYFLKSKQSSLSESMLKLLLSLTLLLGYKLQKRGKNIYMYTCTVVYMHIHIYIYIYIFFLSLLMSLEPSN